MSANFQQRLGKAKQFSEDPIWRRIYKEYFPTMVNMTNYNLHMGPHQYKGIDRSIDLENGQRITIEEKVRSRSNPNDFLLEYESIGKNGSRSPGWIEKPLSCDYICIHEKDSQHTFIFPFQFIQLAWFKNKQKWLDEYKSISVRGEFNACAVPKQVLFTAVYDGTIVNSSNYGK